MKERNFYIRWEEDITRSNGIKESIKLSDVQPKGFPAMRGIKL